MRRLWEEKVNFRPKRDKEPEDSIKHCTNTDYKYKIFYAVGQEYTYKNTKYIDNIFDAVSKYLLKFQAPLYYKLKDNDNPPDGGEWDNYLEHIGLFFFFVGCAGVSIIVWIFNWICWLNQCCCCDFLHNPVNKRIAWWMSFLFLLGILACCISAFVTVNRFGFALEGAWCAFDRIYYDALYGQLIENGERWEGLKNTKTILTNIASFTSSIPSINYNEENFHCKGDECIPVKNFIASIKVLKDADAFELENDIPEETKFIQDVNSVILLDYFDKEANK